MKYFSWDTEKNERLKAGRGISFEEIVFHIERGDVLDILEHPKPDRYKGQRIFVVNAGGYAYLVPFLETESEVVLKTIIPSRKATRQYLRGETGHE
ncbi:MAG: toxin [Terriglobia bacterium]